MNDVAKDIVDLLDGDSSLGLTAGTDLFYSRTPDSPHNSVTVFNTGDAVDNLLDGNSEGLEQPTIQIRVRNTDYTTGYALIRSIKDFLNRKSHFTQAGTYYDSILVSSGPAFLDMDDDNRIRFILNFNIKRRE